MLPERQANLDDRPKWAIVGLPDAAVQESRERALGYPQFELRVPDEVDNH